MADFEFPTPLVPGRRSVTNELGLGTILGNASPVSERWSYLRTRPWPDDTDNTGRRGTAPNIEPYPGSPEYQAAEASLAALQGGAPQSTAASAAAVLGMADVAESQLGARLTALAARAAPIAAAAPSLALAAPLAIIPKSIFDDQTLRLGDRFRASQPPGQNSVVIERRVSDGLLGTGIGAKWEELPPLDATLRVGQYGLRTLVVNADQLHGALGPDAAKLLFETGRVIDRQSVEQTAPGGKDDQPPPPLSLPSKIEMRIWASTDRGLTTSAHEATREQVEQVCPNFPKYEQYAMEAAAKYKAVGLPNGMQYGRLVHRDVELRLKEEGVPEVSPELAILRGESPSYSKGSSRIDIVELHQDHITVCVYELKTGGAPIPMEVVERYSREAGLYAVSKPGGYPNIYFIPIRVP